MKNLQNLNDWLDIEEHQKLGEILVQSAKLNLIHLGMALDIQNFKKMQLGEVLLDMKVISKQDLSDALELQKNIDTIVEQRG